MFEVYQFTFSPVPCVLWFSVGHLSDYSLMNLITFVVFDESTHTYTKMSQHNAMNSIKKSFYVKIYFFTLILAHSSIYFTQPLNSLSMYGGKYSYEWEIFIKFKKNLWWITLILLPPHNSKGKLTSLLRLSVRNLPNTTAKVLL